MQQNILIIGVHFSTIPLVMVNFGNRYTVFTNLIRQLHDEVICKNELPNDAEHFLLQINRLHLIGIIRSSAVMALVLAPTAMIATYFEEPNIAIRMFLCTFTLLVISMLLFSREIQIANTPLDFDLSDLETHQEWQQYMKPNRKRRTKNGQAATKKTGWAGIFKDKDIRK